MEGNTLKRGGGMSVGSNEEYRILLKNETGASSKKNVNHLKRTPWWIGQVETERKGFGGWVIHKRD